MLGGFEDVFGAGADAVSIIDRSSRPESLENARQSDLRKEMKSDEDINEITANGEPFNDLPEIGGGHGNWISSGTTFSDFIEVFEDTYRHGNVGDHISDLLSYAAFRIPEITKTLRAQWRELHIFNEMRNGEWDLSNDCMEELVAPIARAGIGALMMAGISGEEIKEIYGILYRGRYT